MTAARDVRRAPGWCGEPASRRTSSPSCSAPRSAWPGIDATKRFDASASVLATFAVLQLLVYAGLQIPVGRRRSTGSGRGG